MKKIHLFVFITLIICSCNEDRMELSEKIQCSGAYSILVNEGNVFVSGWANDGRQVHSKYWIDDAKADSSGFISLINNGSTYKEAIDDQFRTVYVYKNLQGESEIYQFDQGSFIEGGKIFYYKNNEIIRMNNSLFGTISTLFVLNDKPYFAGYFREITSSETGEVLSPKTPFFWDGSSTLIELPFPYDCFFSGVHCIYISGENDFYIGGLIGVPMYWKNTDPIILDQRYGEVRQITLSGTDVYVAGFFNKNNSNSTGHTACYWKNGQLYELEDDAQADGIYIDGTDVYVSGSVGRVPAQYKACYWKNGIRTDLPD
ncbi:MAG: hypothetical protein AB2L24_30300 [Mangrovibacterium sp.]